MVPPLRISRGILVAGEAYGKLTAFKILRQPAASGTSIQQFPAAKVVDSQEDMLEVVPSYDRRDVDRLLRIVRTRQLASSMAWYNFALDTLRAEDIRMPNFKLPLSGDVVQSINPWTWNFNSVGGQFGVINVNLGQSTEPKVEEEVLSDVGTYGKQLGRIGDVLIVLLSHLPSDISLTDHEKHAIAALKEMLNKVAEVKAKHGRAALRP
jgi:hypothetical protein